MLAENTVIFQPAWTTVALCLSDNQAAVCQEIAGALVGRLDCCIRQEARHPHQWGIYLPQAGLCHASKEVLVSGK